MNTLSWMVVIVLCLIVQGFVLHIAYRRRFAAYQAARLQFQEAMIDKLEQTKRLIGQLQSDLHAARLQAAPPVAIAPGAARDAYETRSALERLLVEATSLRSAEPLHGFADTQLSLQDTERATLVIR
jgi:hypothetical protein